MSGRISYLKYFIQFPSFLLKGTCIIFYLTIEKMKEITSHMTREVCLKIKSAHAEIATNCVFLILSHN